jgi:hypothetical protein
MLGKTRLRTFVIGDTFLCYTIPYNSLIFNYTIACEVLSIDASFYTVIGVYQMPIQVNLKKLINTLCFIDFITYVFC